jgi:hypothetical protein
VEERLRVLGWPHTTEVDLAAVPRALEVPLLEWRTPCIIADRIVWNLCNWREAFPKGR